MRGNCGGEQEPPSSPLRIGSTAKRAVVRRRRKRGTLRTDRAVRVGSTQPTRPGPRVTLRPGRPGRRPGSPDPSAERYCARRKVQIVGFEIVEGGALHAVCCNHYPALLLPSRAPQPQCTVNGRVRLASARSSLPHSLGFGEGGGEGGEPGVRMGRDCHRDGQPSEGPGEGRAGLRGRPAHPPLPRRLHMSFCICVFINFFLS